MEPNLFVDVATRFGVPLALLAIVLWYHARVIKDKDAELVRVNDLRVKEANEHRDKSLEQNQSFFELLGEVDSTLKILLERNR